MEKRNKLILAFLLVLISAYFYLDNKLFYYGKSTFNFYEPLPLELKPVYAHDFEGGFHIEDKYGFWIIAKGTQQYVGTTVELSIDEILKYGISKQSLVVLAKTENQEKYFIELLPSTPNSLKEILVKVHHESNGVIKSNSYKWFEINNKHINTIQTVRNITLLLTICLFTFLVIYQIIKLYKTWYLQQQK